MKRAISLIRSKAVLWPLRIEYYLGAWLEYYLDKLGGGNEFKRLHAYPICNYEGEPPDSAVPERIAIFAAYHPKSAPPTSNIDYIKSLASCGFRIIYIHNGPLNHEQKKPLEPHCELIFCRKNIGQDMGAWKDGYLYLENKGLLAKAEWLLLCNDSNIFIGGDEGDTFKKRFTQKLSQGEAELISLNKNYDTWMHYGSYFLCFHKNLFKSGRFKLFWQKYLPLSHRYHAINNGEVALTREIIGNSKALVIYDSTALYHEVTKNRCYGEAIYPFMPLGAMYLAKQNGLTQPVNPIHLQRILSLLDTRNPSHVYALLFVKILKSPFLKKDLLRQGIFSLTQISHLLESIGLEIGESKWQEIMDNYINGGSNASFLRYKKEAFRKGINPEGLGKIQGYRAHLSGLGLGLGWAHKNQTTTSG